MIKADLSRSHVIKNHLFKKFANKYYSNISIIYNLLNLKMDPFFLAMSKFNRQRFDECVDICTQMLDKNPYD